MPKSEALPTTRPTFGPHCWERDQTRMRAQNLVRQAEERIATLEREKKGVVRLQLEATKRNLHAGDYWNEIENLDREILQATKDLKRSQRTAEESNRLWARVQSVIHETRNLAGMWEALSLTARKRVLDQWVDGVLIAVEPIEGKRRANHKFGGYLPRIGAGGAERDRVR